MLRLTRRGRLGDRASCAAEPADVAATRRIRRRRPRELRRGGEHPNGSAGTGFQFCYNRRGECGGHGVLHPAAQDAGTGCEECYNHGLEMLEPRLAVLRSADRRR